MKLTKRIIGLLLLALNLLAVAALLLAGLGRIVNPATLTLPSLVGLGFEWIAAVNLLFALFWLFTRKKGWALISAIALLCSFTPLSHTFALPAGSRAGDAGKKTLTILSYNTRRLDMFAKPEKNRILHYICQQDADIVCLQEFETYKDNTYLTLSEVKAFLHAYPYSYIDFKEYKGRRQYGLAVFSKYPLLNKRTLHYESHTNISNRCDVLIGNDTVRLFNNHLESNRLTENDLSLLTRFSEMSSDGMRTSAGNITHKLRHAYRFRSQQAACICREVSESPYPVIVCGDFNDVPVSYLYRHIARGLQDAFLEGGKGGTGHTFCGKGIGWRIDYILHSETFGAYGFRIDKVPYSDHYPITCTLEF